MYGSEHINNHHILRYGLTIEFCEVFSSIKYLDIEVPLTLIRYFHLFIKQFVDSNLTNYDYINKLQKKYNINTMKDVQKALSHKPKIKKDLSKEPNRNTILMPAALVTFPLDQFPDAPVLLMVLNHYDKTALIGKKLPKNFIKYSFSRAQSMVKIPMEVIGKLQGEFENILSTVNNHEIFGKPEFRRWFLRYLNYALKWVHLLDNLIKKAPIGLIFDYVEIIVPGNILAMLAIKYNLPFINAPKVLITDRSIIPTYASSYFVWGNNYKNWLEKRGIDSSKIYITGNLQYEYAKSEKSMPKADFLKLLNIPTDNFIVTFTSQTFAEEVNLTLMNWITDSINDLPITFVIRPHPSDSFDYTRFLKGSKIVLTPKTMHLYNILENTDFLTTISSNTAIEAAILKKGLIILQPDLPYNFEHNNNDFNAFLVKSGAGLAIYDHQELRVNLKKLIEDKDFRTEIVKQGQLFLRDTLDLNHSPSTVIPKLILGHIKEK